MSPIEVFPRQSAARRAEQVAEIQKRLGKLERLAGIGHGVDSGGGGSADQFGQHGVTNYYLDDDSVDGRVIRPNSINMTHCEPFVFAPYAAHGSPDNLTISENGLSFDVFPDYVDDLNTGNPVRLMELLPHERSAFFGGRVSIQPDSLGLENLGGKLVEGQVPDQFVTSRMIADGSIEIHHFRENVIPGEAIIDDAVGASQIAQLAVQQEHMQAKISSATRNRIANSQMDRGVEGWTGAAGSYARTADTTTPFRGTYALKLLASAASVTAITFPGDAGVGQALPVLEGLDYTLSGYSKSEGATAQQSKVAITWYQADGGVLSTSTGALRSYLQQYRFDNQAGFDAEFLRFAGTGVPVVDEDNLWLEWDSTNDAKVNVKPDRRALLDYGLIIKNFAETTPGTVSLILKKVDDLNYLKAQMTGANLQLFKVVAGTPTQLGSNVAFSRSVGVAYWLEASIAGNAVTIKVFTDLPWRVPAPTAGATLSHTLTGGDITQFGAAVEVTDVGFGYTPGALNGYLDDFSIFTANLPDYYAASVLTAVAPANAKSCLPQLISNPDNAQITWVGAMQLEQITGMNTEYQPGPLDLGRGVITAHQLQVNSLDALTVNAGLITAGTFRGTIFETSASNPKVRMDTSGFYVSDASGNKPLEITAAGGLRFMAGTSNDPEAPRRIVWLRTPATTIASGSNGVGLPTGTINVVSTEGFPDHGVMTVVTGAGAQSVAYTGKTSTSFTGCTGGTGTMSTGGAVSGSFISGDIYAYGTGGANPDRNHFFAIARSGDPNLADAEVAGVYGRVAPDEFAQSFLLSQVRSTGKEASLYTVLDYSGANVYEECWAFTTSTGGKLIIDELGNSDWVKASGGDGLLRDADTHNVFASGTRPFRRNKVGALIPTVSFPPPASATLIDNAYLLADGAAVSRTTYADLFAAICVSTTGSRTNSSKVITAIPSTTGMQANMPLSGTGFAAGTLIQSVDSGTQITATNNFTGTTGSGAFVVAPFGVGDGSTTFNLPDLRTAVPVGQYTSGAFQRLGAGLGTETHTLTLAESPAHAHQHTVYAPTAGGNNLAAGAANNAGGGGQIASTSQGGGNAHNNIQPSIVVNYLVQV